MKDYTTFYQHVQVIVHEELFESQRAMERLRAPFFEMRENVSSVTTDVPPAKDLTKRPLNQIVTDTSFFEDNEFTNVYDNHESHDMLDPIVLGRRLAWRMLCLRLGYVKRVTTITGRTDNENDTDTSLTLDAGLEDSFAINEMKIGGAILNPLFQNDIRMIDAGMCTEDQYQSGREELVNRLTRCYKGQQEESSEVDGNEDDNAGEETTNEWTKLKDSGSASADSPAVLAMAELDLYESFIVAK